MAAEDQPFLQIVRGDPSAEEIAALVAVLTARAQAALLADRAARDTAGDRPVSRWADRSRTLRGAVAQGVPPRGRGAWRASAFPR